MRLRIVAGELGGRYIEAPRGRRTRPTSERVREAWFNALADRLPGARVLDLFAGSGALGIEALSRGAQRAHFVEADRRAAEVLRRNLSALGLEKRAGLTVGDVFAYLRRLEGAKEPFDLAVADPPYAGPEPLRLAGAFRRAPFATLLCIEHAPGVLDREERVVRRRRYGDTELSFLAAERAVEPSRGRIHEEDEEA
jgi:16S rRNA (guanine966-N2)-methyltransferase